MTIIQSIILGIIQGITEFLPISSSGHLVLVPKVFGWAQEQPLEFDAILHLATLVAVLIFFRKDILNILKNAFVRNPQSKEFKRLGWIIVAGTIPAVIFGLLIQMIYENPFRNINIVIINLIGWAIVMFIVDTVMKINKNIKSVEKIGWRQGIYVGLAQAFALIPGTSRSGITMTIGLVEGMNRATAARFAFLLGIPAIMAAGAASIYEIISNPAISIGSFELTLGFFSALISGYLAIHFLIKFLQKYSLSVFVLYRLVLGLILIWIFW
jgi:undecaprenyl-diphosphatase